MLAAAGSVSGLEIGKVFGEAFDCNFARKSLISVIVDGSIFGGSSFCAGNSEKLWDEVYSMSDWLKVPYLGHGDRLHT